MSPNTQRFDSRQSMKTKTFEIFHYRDKQPGSVGLHYHDFYEVYFFLNGQVEFRVEGRSYRMESGDLLLISPQELHQAVIEPATTYERMVLWIDRNFLTGLSTPETDLTGCFGGDSISRINLLRPAKLQRVAIGQLMSRLHRESLSRELGSDVLAQSLMMQLMVELSRFAQQTVSRIHRLEEPDLVAQVLAYIGIHYRENITLESLASAFFVSKYHLSHEFSHRVGTSIYRYVIFRRLTLARELITDGAAPGDIFQTCGFGDYANFYRAFKTEYGISPREFAAKVKATENTADK